MHSILRNNYICGDDNYIEKIPHEAMQHLHSIATKLVLVYHEASAYFPLKKLLDETCRTLKLILSLSYN